MKIGQLTPKRAVISLFAGTLATFLVSPSLVNVYAQSQTPKVTQELRAFDTSYARVYENPDGTISSKVYFSPVNYKDSQGNYHHIDTNFVPSTSKGFQVTKNVFQTYFSNAANSSNMETVDYQGKTVSFAFAPTALTAGLGSGLLSTPGAGTPHSDHNALTYSNILPSVSLQEHVTSGGVKEEIVLDKYQPGLHTFAFVLGTKGVTPQTAADGSIIFVDTKGNTVFKMPPGVMTDSNVDPHSGDAQSSNAVTYTLKKILGKTVLVVSVDASWLADPKRVYPVYIDPTTIKAQMSDAYVSSAYPTTNYSGSNLWNANQNHYDLHLGTYDSTTGENWPYFKLPNSSQLPLLGLTVNSATFNVYCDWSYYSTTAEPIWLWSNTSNTWSPTTITWNTKPGHSASYMGPVSVHQGQWASFDISSLAEQWFDLNNNPGSAPEQGLMLSEDGNGQTYWHKVVATEDSQDPPYITLNYGSPSTPWGALYTHDDAAHDGYVNLWWNQVPGATSYDVDILERP